MSGIAHRLLQLQVASAAARTAAAGARRTAAAAARRLLLVVVVGLPACATQFNVQHVPIQQLPEQLREVPGIYFALPKTVIDVAIPVEVSVSRPGPWAALEEDCFSACAAPGEKICQIKAKDARYSFKLKLPPTLTPRQVPDPHQVYRSEVPVNLPFITVDHELTLASGSLQSAKLSGSNELLTSAVALAKAAIPFLPATKTKELDFALSALVDSKSQLKFASSCEQLVQKIDAPAPLDYLDPLERNERLLGWLAEEHGAAKKLSCVAVRCIQTTLQTLQRQTYGWRQRAAQVVWGGPNPVVGGSAELLNLRIKTAKQAADALQAREAALRKTLGMDEPEAKRQITLASILPLDPAVGSAEFNWVAMRTNVRWIVPADLTLAQRATEKEALDKALQPPTGALHGLQVKIDPLSGTLNQGPPIIAGESTSGQGYRYRLPAPAALTLWQGSTLLHQQETLVSQYGRLAELPSKFAGINAKLNFTLDSYGSLQKVGLGQAAQSTATATDFLDSVAARRAERDAAPQKAADAAVAAAQAKVDARKLSLCLQALDQLGPGSTELPAICK